MNRLLLLALAACCGAAHAYAQAPPPAATPDPPKPPAAARNATAPTAPKPTPFQSIADETFNAELKDVDGAGFFLSNYRGRVFVINVWATWCGPCRTEIPELNRIYRDYSSRGVEFVGLSTEDPKVDAERVRDFVSQFEMKYKVGYADGATARALLAGNYSIPQTLVVAPDGHIVVRFRGYSQRLPTLLRAAIEKALRHSDEPSPPAPADP